MSQGLAILFLLLFLLLLIYATIRVRAGHMPTLRQIRAFDTLKGLTGRSMEAGRSLHLSLGIGSVVNNTTADSLAGLSLLRYLAKQSTATGVPPIVSMADPTVMLYAQNVLGAAADTPDDAAEAYRHVRWMAPQSSAYAAGVMNLINIEQTEGNVMLGNFGDEYLLIGETAAGSGTKYIGGTSDPNTLPFIYATAEEALLGEEIYAAGAYLEKQPAHIGSLIAQDTMRWLIFLFILAGILIASLSG